MLICLHSIKNIPNEPLVANIFQRPFERSGAGEIFFSKLPFIFVKAGPYCHIRLAIFSSEET